MAALVTCACAGSSGPKEDDGGGITSERDAEAADAVSVAPVLQGDGAIGDSGDIDGCDPVQPYVGEHACPSNEVCAPDEPYQMTSSCGGNVGTGLQGTGCVTSVDCAGGYDCVALGSHRLCARYCRYDSHFVDCGTSLTCTALLPPAYYGGTEIGICL